MRTFIYCRVSTREQDTQNQVLAIERAGYKVPESRVISEDISGSVQAMQRLSFGRWLSTSWKREISLSC